MSSDLILTKDKVRVPRSREGIMEILSKVLAKPFVTRIVLDESGVMQVTWMRAPTDTLFADADDEPEFVLTTIELEELEIENSGPKSTIVDAMTKMAIDGYVPTFFMCQQTKLVKKWLGFPIMVALPTSETHHAEKLLGCPIIEAPSLLENTLVLCGSLVHSSALSSIMVGYKINMENSND
jgi:hypothetical protein